MTAAVAAKQSAAREPNVITLVKTKETSASVVFSNFDGSLDVKGNIYVRTEAYEEMGSPEEITVTVMPA